MDWPASSEARDPLPFPTAHIAPCARITTRIYHPPHLTQAGLITGLSGAASTGMYAQQAQQGRVETVRDVLVEIAGPSRDEMGRPIIPTPTQPMPNQQQQRQQQVVAQRIGGRTTINNNNSSAAATNIDADDGAGFTGAGGFLLGGMANAVSVTGGHNNSGGNLMAGANVGGGTAGGGVAATGGGGGGGMGDDDDDSMSSGWSTSDSEMSYDNNGTAGQGGGPTRPNPAFGGGGGGGGGATNTGTGHHSHHHHQEYQPPQRAYLLQRTLREAIYGRVRYGIVLKRRQLPPDYDASTSSQPMAEWEVTNERCAVKEMSWQHIRKERNRLAEDPIKEVSAMQYLKRYLAQCHGDGSPTSLDSSDAMLSTHIMLPLDLLSDDRYLYSVMPYCDGGELFDRLDQRQKFSEDEARYWMHQILDGVDNLQRAGICHRDMSLENLLVHKDRICLVIDMGMCLRIPYEGGKKDASDLFDAAGAGDSGGGGHDDSKRPRALSTGTDLRKSFMSMDLDNGAGGGAVGADANGTVDASNEKKCCLDIRQRKRYLMKPQGTCGKWHYMTSVSYLVVPVVFWRF